MSYFSELSKNNNYYLSLSNGKNFRNIGFVSSMKEVKSEVVAYASKQNIHTVTAMLGTNIMDDCVDSKTYDIEISIKEVKDKKGTK